MSTPAPDRPVPDGTAPDRPTSVPSLEALRALEQRLASEVDAARDAETRRALKDEIVGLYRAAEAAEREARALQAAAKALAGRWRSGDGGHPTPARGGTSARVDHLGASTFVEKGWSRLALGDAAAAVEALQRALALAPGHAHAETLLAWALLEQGMPEAALRHLHLVLLRDPQAALARACVGYACLRAEAHGEAIEHLSRVVRQGTDPTATLYAHLWLGLVYFARDMLADAQDCFRQALALGPNLLQAAFELGRAQWFAGERVAARETWRAGAASNTFNPWGKRCAEVLAMVERGEAPSRAFEGVRGA